MKIEALTIKNFRAFKDVNMQNIPSFCVLIGANGTGKTTLFSLFGFLKEALNSNVTTALAQLGGARGFDEVRSRGCTGAIEISLQFRETSASPKITYELVINKINNAIVIEKEILKYRRGAKGQPWHFLNFANGRGEAVINEDLDTKEEAELKREEQVLKSPDILAVKGLAQFQRFKAAVSLSELIENWHVSDIQINKARPEVEANYAEQLSRDGDNLALVIQYLYQNHKDIFDTILESLTKSIPGITKIEAKTTEEGRVMLKFQDGAFADPFLSRYVSDGTIKMLAYLVLLHTPKAHQLLCVEEPENQLYPSLLLELAEEFRNYSARGGQVFVSTHSPDFLNAMKLEEVYCLVKEKGYTQIKKAADNAQVKAYMEDGDKMGYLWKQGFFEGVNP